jgi:hypothetical protein
MRLATHGAFAATVLLAGCSPCLGVAGCDAIPPAAAVSGQVVTSESLQPIPGTPVDLIVVSPSGRDSVATVTDDDGLFTARLPAPPGSQMALRVRPPGKPGYIIDSLPCNPVTRASESCVLDPLVELPTFPTYIFRYRHNGLPAGGVNVRFARTGGAPFFVLVGQEEPEYSVKTEISYGVGVPFPPGLFAASLEPMIFDLTAELPPPFGTMTRSGFRIKPNPWYRRQVIEQYLGPAMYYVVEFRDSVTNAPFEGVHTVLARLGGAAMQVDSSISVSNADGLSWLNLGAMSNGNMDARLTMRAPIAGAPTVSITPLTVPTFDADTARKLSRWSVGATGKLYPLPPP